MPCLYVRNSGLHLPQRNHPSLIGIPELEPQAAPHFHGIPGSCRNGLEFRDAAHGFAQAVERNPGVHVVDVVVADVAREPVHDRVHDHETA